MKETIRLSARRVEHGDVFFLYIVSQEQYPLLADVVLFQGLDT
jgi:hypothetical protein